MRLTRLLSLPILVGALSLGCGDDDGPTGPTVAQFAGTWNATSITYTSTATPAVAPPAVDRVSPRTAL